LPAARSCPNIDGPVHKYVPSAPGCWRIFGEVQADEMMMRFRYPPADRLFRMLGATDLDGYDCRCAVRAAWDESHNLVRSSTLDAM
jgi:hypothetical protein